MAVDLFLKINGVKSDSKDKAYFKDIDLLTWSLCVQNNGSAHSGAGAESDKVCVDDGSQFGDRSDIR